MGKKMIKKVILFYDFYRTKKIETLNEMFFNSYNKEFFRIR